MPGEQVDAMIEARGKAGPPAARPAPSPLVFLLQELADRPAIAEFALSQNGDTIVWRRA
jgi:hypothetical protein